MKNIVVYYSLTGKTKAMAEGFAKELGCDIVLIEETKKRSMLGAYVMGAFAAMKGRTSEIIPVNQSFEEYDTIFLATPVWASCPVPAINSFMANTSLKGKNAVLLICPASGDDSKTAAILTKKIQAKGGAVLQHHAFKTGGTKESELIEKAKEIARLYK